MSFYDKSEFVQYVTASVKRAYGNFTSPLVSAFHKFRPQNNNYTYAAAEFGKTAIHGVMTVGSAGMLAMAFYYAAQNQDTQVGRNTGKLMEGFFGAATCLFARRAYIHGRDGVRAIRQADEQAIMQALKREI